MESHLCERVEVWCCSLCVCTSSLCPVSLKWYSPRFIYCVCHKLQLPPPPSPTWHNPSLSLALRLLNVMQCLRCHSSRFSITYLNKQGLCTLSWVECVRASLFAVFRLSQIWCSQGLMGGWLDGRMRRWMRGCIHPGSLSFFPPSAPSVSVPYTTLFFLHLTISISSSPYGFFSPFGIQTSIRVCVHVCLWHARMRVHRYSMCGDG